MAALTTRLDHVGLVNHAGDLLVPSPCLWLIESRRKKTKCPGERPTCSFCSRLRQTCYYVNPQGGAFRVHKSGKSRSDDQPVTYSEERFERLEERLNEMAATMA
jgi:hypothetical protein